MPLPPAPQKPTANKPASKGEKANKEVLIKGMTIALIGIIILLAPIFKPESGIGQLFAQSYLVGWFALILGAAFIAQFLLRRKKG